MRAQPSWPATQASLLLRLKEASDAEAWSDFSTIYSPLIYRYCRRRGFQDADAAEVVQEVLARVATSIGEFDYDPQRGKFRGWLGTLTRQCMQQVAQRAGRIGAGRGGDAGMAALIEAAGEDGLWTETFAIHIYECALDRIRHDFGGEVWSAFDLLWMQDAPPATVAQQVQRPLPWVYKAKFRVLQRLRAEIEFLTSEANLPYR